MSEDKMFADDMFIGEMSVDDKKHVFTLNV